MKNVPQAANANEQDTSMKGKLSLSFLVVHLSKGSCCSFSKRQLN